MSTSCRSVVEDALELATTMAAAPAETGTGTEGNKETASSANMSDCDWAIRELEDLLKRFSVANNNFALRGEELKRKEAEYDAKARSNAAEATKNFSEKVVKFMPHVLDKDRFLKELPAILQDRVQEISVDMNTSPENVLVCFFADLTSQGAPTISVREEIDVRASVVCGKAGLAIIMASDTPSTKGRPTPKKASRGSAVGAPAVGAVAAAAADGAPPVALEGRPAGIPVIRSTKTGHRRSAFCPKTLRTCSAWAAPQRTGIASRWCSSGAASTTCEQWPSCRPKTLPGRPRN